MDIQDAIYGRRAVRDYADAPLDRGVITSLIEAAIQAPSAVNRQAWAFSVVGDRNLLQRCSASAKTRMLAALDANPDLAGFRDHLAAPEFNIFYNAPVLVVISATIADPMTREDCCLAAENLMLAAHAKGLGTCWIGFAEAWLREPEGKSQLGIPADHQPVAPIILGHPKETPPRPERRTPAIRWVGL